MDRLFIAIAFILGLCVSLVGMLFTVVLYAAVGVGAYFLLTALFQ